VYNKSEDKLYVLKRSILRWQISIKFWNPATGKNGSVNTVVEIPEGSILKIEWDRKRAAFMIDRVEPNIFPKPCSLWFYSADFG